MHHSAPLKLQPQVQPLACSTGITKASLICAVCVMVEQITSVPASCNFLSSRTRWIWNDAVVVAFFYPIQIAPAPSDVLWWHGNILCLTSSSCAFTCKLTLWKLQSLYQFLHHMLELWNTFCSTTMCWTTSCSNIQCSIFISNYPCTMHSRSLWNLASSAQTLLLPLSLSGNDSRCNTCNKGCHMATPVCVTWKVSYCKTLTANVSNLLNFIYRSQWLVIFLYINITELQKALSIHFIV